MLQQGRTQVDKAGIGGAAGQGIDWNPGAPADPAYATTWAEVMVAFAESSGEFRVSLDTSGGGAFNIPVGTYALDSRLQLSRPAPALGQVTVVMADGAVLQNLAGVFRNITLQTNGTAAAALQLTSGRAIEFDLGAVLQNSGTFAALSVAAAATAALQFYRGSAATATGAPIATVAATGSLTGVFQENSQASTSWATGAGALAYRADSSFTTPTLASPPAAITATQFDKLSSTIWNPGAPVSPSYATTWADVMTRFAQSPTGEAFRVTLDESGGGAFTIPAGTYALESRLQLSRPAPATSQLTVTMADGAVLQNLAGVYRNITLQANPTAAPALTLTSGRGIEFDAGSILENAGSYAALEVAAGETVALSFYRGSRATATSDVIADLTAATARLNATFEGDSQASTDWTSGVAGTTLDYRADASYTAVTLAAPPASVNTTQVDDAATTLGYLWSPLDFQVSHGGIVLTAGNFTNGHRFRPLKTFTITGIRLYWAGAPAVSLKCSIWDSAGALLATVTIVTSGIGVYTATFATPITVSRTAGTGVANWYSYGIYETTGASYTRIANIMTAMGPFNSQAFVSFSFVWDMTTAMFVAGDARPTGTVGNTIPSELVVAA